MAFGVTPTGFILKRLTDVQEETLDAFRSAFGDGFDLDPRTPEGLIKGILDERIALIHELLQALYFSQYPMTAEGINLDNVVSLTGLTRKQATKSLIDSGVARGVFGTLIPIGTVISVSGDSTARFVTSNPVTIDEPAINEVQLIAFDDAPDSGSFALTFDGQTTSLLLFSATAANVKSALEALTNIDTVNVTGNFTIGFTVEFTGTGAGLNQPQIGFTTNTLLLVATPIVVTTSTTTQGDKAKASGIQLDGEVTGPLSAPTNSLIVIETPVAGLEEFTNLQDAEIGTNTETDAELKLRREQELQRAGAATLEAIRSRLLSIDDVTAVVVFQNLLHIFDIDGRPPHSVDIVVQGGDEDDIAEEIFNTVAAGIQTIGDILEMVTDSQGFSHIVKFSRPDEIDIWLEVDLTTDADYPVDGDDQAEAALLAFGNSLTISQDVIVYPRLVCSLDGIPGITDVTIRIGTAPAPTLDDNIIISPREIAKFDSARITVTSL